MRLKVTSFWKEEIKSAGKNSRRVWWTVDNVFGEARSGTTPALSSEGDLDSIDKNI